jgi:hypothetical protein
VDAWPTEPFAVRAKEWKYRTHPMTVKSSLQGGAQPKDTLLNRVRALYKVPYKYGKGEELAYRRISDNIGPSEDSYRLFMKPLRDRRELAELALASNEGPGTKNSWSQIWEEVNSWQGN